MGVSSTRNAISRSKSRCGPCVAHPGCGKWARCAARCVFGYRIQDPPPRMGVSSTRNTISRSKSCCGPCVAHAGMRKVGSLCCAVRVRLSRIGGRPRMCPGCAQGAPGGPGCGQHVPRVRPRCAQGAPGCVRDAPRMCPGCPRVPRMRPACAQGAPRVRPVCPRVPRMRPSCAHGGPGCPGCVHHPCAGCAQGA